MSEYMGNNPIQNIRIQSKPNDKLGHRVSVYNADTGENIGNIERLVVILEPGNVNQAIVTYHKVDEQGRVVVGEECKLIRKTETLDNPEVDTTALVIPDAIVDKARALWEIAKELGQRAGHSVSRCPFCNYERDDWGYYLHNSDCIILRAERLTKVEGAR